MLLPIKIGSTGIAEGFLLAFDTDILIVPVSGQIELTQDISILLTDDIYNGIKSDVTTTISIDARFIESIFGGLVAGSDSLVRLTGTPGIIGSVSLDCNTDILLLDNWIRGSVELTTNTLLSLVGGLAIDSTLDIYHSTIIRINGYIVNPAVLLGDLIKASSVICMNTKTNGISTYTKYNFNSFFKIGSDYYGCSTSGLYKLVGDTDAGSEIQATLSTPVQDFDSQKLKAIRDCYAYIRSSGDINVRLITNEQTDRSGYVLAYDNVDGIHRRRVKVAQGLRGTTWQCIITNESGAAFELKQVDVIPKELDRSI